MKKSFENAQLEIVSFGSDVIVTSVTTDGGGGSGSGPSQDIGG